MQVFSQTRLAPKLKQIEPFCKRQYMRNEIAFPEFTIEIDLRSTV